MQDPKEKEIPPTDDATGIYEFPPDWEYEITEEELREIYTNHEEGSQPFEGVWWNRQTHQT